MGEEDAYINSVVMVMNANMMIKHARANLAVLNNFFVCFLSEILFNPAIQMSCFLT